MRWCAVPLMASVAGTFILAGTGPGWSVFVAALVTLVCAVMVMGDD